MLAIRCFVAISREIHVRDPAVRLGDAPVFSRSLSADPRVRFGDAQVFSRIHATDPEYVPSVGALSCTLACSRASRDQGNKRRSRVCPSYNSQSHITRTTVKRGPTITYCIVTTPSALVTVRIRSNTRR